MIGHSRSLLSSDAADANRSFHRLFYGDRRVTMMEYVKWRHVYWHFLAFLDAFNTKVNLVKLIMFI